MDDREKDMDTIRVDDQDDPVFKAEEITIEEMAIDGICGVY